MRLEKRTALVAGVVAVLSAGMALALSVQLPSPTIGFSAEQDKATAEAVDAVLSQKKFHFANGIYSHWPPKWQTTLVYEGDTKQLQAMLDDLRQLPKMHVKVMLVRDLAKRTAEKRRNGDFWIEYSRETPNVLSVLVDLSSPDIDPEKLDLTLDATPAH